MQNRDSFDDPESAGIFTNIVRTLDVRHHFEARRPLWAGGLVVATVAVLGAVLFYTYPREAAQQELAAAPIIRADAGPIKIAPDDPGGMDIPHRQSVVFDALGAPGERRVENLLPDAEEPLPREELFAGLKTEIAPEDAIEDVTAGVTAEPETFDEVASYTPPAETPAPVAKAVEPTPVEAKTVAKTEPAAGLNLAAKEVVKGTHFVQLASVKDEAAAKAEWKKMQAAHGVLAPLTLRVQRADLGERGTFYRIQGGPVAEADAREICKAVESKKPGGCLVVKP
ncbi:MAG: SPOR domain-containing protein [Alphaproteobacteria bacterium]|nr:SPOR domain-containing protein [Alphaproteobacteria bacterium]